MICPNCGKVENNIEVPLNTKKFHASKLGICLKCNEKIYSVGTTKKKENSRKETVQKGENSQFQIANIYMHNHRGDFLEDQGKYADIDYLIRNRKGEPLYYLEVKERTCSINAYRYTQFRYAKITTGQELRKETGLPVYILIKFTDCWARLEVKLNKNYTKGNDDFIPNDRDSSHKTGYQKPVKIHVHNLDILNIIK